MMKNAQIISQISLINLDKAKPQPLSRQIYDGLRQAILNQVLPPGSRLPSHLDLARLLSVSRNTVVAALDQLVAEGYLQTRVGSGTYIARDLPETYIQAAPLGVAAPLTEAAQHREFSPPGDFNCDFNPDWYLHHQTRHNMFRHGLPDLKAFPYKTWESITRRYLRSRPGEWFGFHRDPAGYGPLREALAGHLRIARSVDCDSSQIMIVSGVEQVIYLAARLLLEPGQQAWVENPGFPGASRAFLAAGVVPVSIPVDSSGLDVDAGLQIAPEAKLVYVSPSHQFPVGGTLSLKRRLQLLNWAAENNAWIIEGDYDSEYRYDGRPLPSMQGLDQHQRVIYLGTFTNVLYPGLRLDYAVLPRELFSTFLKARTVLDIHIATLNQAICADFIREGHLARHIRRMRKLYHTRRDEMVKALTATASGWLEPGEATCGMHLCAWLPDTIPGEVVFQEAAKVNIEAMPLSRFCLDPAPRNGLVLGFTACETEFIRPGVETLVNIIRSL